MHNVMFEQMPRYVEEEMELIGANVESLTKKSAIYTFVSVPMMVFSIMNLLVSILTEGTSSEVIYSQMAFAFLAAIGIALQQETRMLRKEIQVKSNEQIIDRIKCSEYITGSRKDEYIALVKEEPLSGFTTFINFLTEEEKRKNLVQQAG